MQFDSRLGLYTCNEILNPLSVVGMLTGARGKIAAAVQVGGVPSCRYSLVDSRIELNSCQEISISPTFVGTLTEKRGKIAAAVHVVGAPLCHYQLIDSRIELYSCRDKTHKTHAILTEARGKILAQVRITDNVVLDPALDAVPATLEGRGTIKRSVSATLMAERGLVVGDLFVYHDVQPKVILDAEPGTLEVELLVHQNGVASLIGEPGTLIGDGFSRLCHYQLLDSRIELYMCNEAVSFPHSTLTGARGKIAALFNVEISPACYHSLVDSRIELYACTAMEPATYGFLTGARGKIAAQVGGIPSCRYSLVDSRIELYACPAVNVPLCAFQIPDQRFELPQLFTARRHVPQGRLVVNPTGPLSNRLKTASISQLGRRQDTLDQRKHDPALSLFLYFSCNQSSTRFEANNVVAIYNEQDEPLLALDLIGIDPNATQPDVVRVRSHIMSDPPFVDVLLTPTTMGGRWYKMGVTLAPIENETAIFVHQGGRSKFEVGTFSSFERTSWKTQFAPEVNVNIVAAYTWDRVLSDAEYWQLSEHPFDIWSPD